MNDTMMRASDDELGSRLAAALDRRVAGLDAGFGAGGVDLRGVRRGAGRRRAVRRAGVALACTAVAAAAVVVIARRDSEPPAQSDNPPIDVPTPNPIGAVAVLPPTFGDPVFVYASRGGAPTGADLPQVDVWQSGTKRIVVRTFVDLPDDPAPTVPITTAPPPTTAAVVADGSPVLEAIADDQWVAFLTTGRDQGDNIVLRGMTRAEAEAAVGAMTVVGGVRQPPPGFELVEHADPAPASTPTGWWVQVGYGDGVGGDTWSSAWEPTPGRATLELATGWQVGAIERIGGREVLLVQDLPGQTGSSWTWIDESGTVVGVRSYDPVLDASVVASVSLVGPEVVDTIADALSARLAVEPALASTRVDAFDLTIRGDGTGVAMCIGSGDAEQCQESFDAGTDAPPIVMTMDTLVDGEWVVFGAYQVVDGDRPNIADDRYTTPDGTVLPINVIGDDGYLWYVIRVPAGARSITTDWRNDTGGVVGQVQRPIVVGLLG